MSSYRHCITEGSADRQHQFEQALLDLMNEKLLAQISIQEICDRIGLSRKSFYRYFSSKEACLNALVDHTLMGTSDVPIRGEHVRQMLERYFTYWGQHRALLDALYRNDLSSVLMERAMLCAVQEYGVRDRQQENRENYAKTIFFVSGLIGVLLDWHLTGCRMTPIQLAATLSEFLPQYPRGVF